MDQIAQSTIVPSIQRRRALRHPVIRQLAKRRMQLSIGMLLAVILPYFMRVDLAYAQTISSQNQFNSLIATACAVTIGYWLFRQLTKFPGILSTSYIIPAFAIAYGAVLVAFFFLRLDYSRLFFAVSFVNALVWFHFAHLIVQKFNRPVFDVLPFGNAKSVTEVAGADWIVLDEADPKFVSRDGLIADLRADLSDEWEAIVTEQAIKGTPVYHYKQMKEMMTGRVDIEHLSENTLGSLLPDIIYLKFKRLVDLIGALLVLPFLLPLFAVVAILIRREDGGPVFFHQARMGYQGEVFNVLKFRTMSPSDPQPVTSSAATPSETDEDGTIEAAKTKRGDQRITRFGRFLRKTRIDELPQILNIIKGEMSWIGPRPEAVPLSMLYQTKLPYYRYRHIVRPGITGWAQVNQGHVAEVDEVLDKLHYDFYYIKQFSIWLDVLITMRTIRVVLTGHGAR